MPFVTSHVPQLTPAQRLRSLLEKPGLIAAPGCFDALSAKLVEEAGFPLTFMGGFSVAAARLGLPDTGLISYGEMADQGRAICAAVSIPVVGDGDTGYGNAVNVKRTVRGYAAAGFAAILVEDQVWPKRCGHTRGKQVVGFDEAVARVRAACDARDEGADILILGRTDARAVLGLDEALRRARAFAEAGADILFVEAPESEAEMERICAETPGWHLANQLEYGMTPMLSLERLEAIGFKLAVYPLTLLSAAIRAQRACLAELRAGRVPTDRLLEFAVLRTTVGFDDYYAEEARYTAPSAEE
jgi:2-methylisocitrate lyase-like PEP mutase family enzyme